MFEEAAAVVSDNHERETDDLILSCPPASNSPARIAWLRTLLSEMQKIINQLNVHQLTSNDEIEMLLAACEDQEIKKLSADPDGVDRRAKLEVRFGEISEKEHLTAKVCQALLNLREILRIREEQRRAEEDSMRRLALNGEAFNVNKAIWKLAMIVWEVGQWEKSAKNEKIAEKSETIDKMVEMAYEFPTNLKILLVELDGKSEEDLRALLPSDHGTKTTRLMIGHEIENFAIEFMLAKKRIERATIQHFPNRPFTTIPLSPPYPPRTTLN